jgi:DNA-binding NarL/FixJ family response regulator
LPWVLAAAIALGTAVVGGTVGDARRRAAVFAVAVVLTTFDADQYVLRTASGAAGFLVKSTPPEELIGLVRVAADCHAVLSPAADRRLRRQPARRPNRPAIWPARSPSARWRCSPARRRAV